MALVFQDYNERCCASQSHPYCAALGLRLAQEERPVTRCSLVRTQGQSGASSLTGNRDSLKLLGHIHVEAS